MERARNEVAARTIEEGVCFRRGGTSGCRAAGLSAEWLRECSAAGMSAAKQGRIRDEFANHNPSADQLPSPWSTRLTSSCPASGSIVGTALQEFMRLVMGSFLADGLGVRMARQGTKLVGLCLAAGLSAGMSLLGRRLAGSRPAADPSAGTPPAQPPARAPGCERRIAYGEALCSTRLTGACPAASLNTGMARVRLAAQTSGRPGGRRGSRARVRLPGALWELPNEPPPPPAGMGVATLTTLGPPRVLRRRDVSFSPIAGRIGSKLIPPLSHFHNQKWYLGATMKARQYTCTVPACRKKGKNLLRI